jgi:hypothetical protein
LVFLGACRSDPAGEEATLGVRWCVYGQTANADWCGLAGIETVQMVEDDEPLDDFTWPCRDGALVPDGPNFAAGDYTIRFEALDAAGYVVASTHDPEVSLGDDVTVNDGDRIVLDHNDFDTGQTGSVDVPVRFESPAGGEPLPCDGAGIDAIGWEFFVDACGTWQGVGVAVRIEEGRTCDDANFRLAGVPFGVYSLGSAGSPVVATAGELRWEGTCAGLVLREDSVVAGECTIPLAE